MIKVWGPSTWSFIHIFCQNINEKQLLSNKNEVYNFLGQILCNLPCPECSYHSRNFIINCNFNNLNSKQQLIDLFFIFHNKVSARINSKNPKLVSVPNQIAAAIVKTSHEISQVLVLADVAWKPNDNEMVNAVFDNYDFKKWFLT